MAFKCSRIASFTTLFCILAMHALCHVPTKYSAARDLGGQPVRRKVWGQWGFPRRHQPETRYRAIARDKPCIVVAQEGQYHDNDAKENRQKAMYAWSAGSWESLCLSAARIPQRVAGGVYDCLSGASPLPLWLGRQDLKDTPKCHY